MQPPVELDAASWQEVQRILQEQIPAFEVWAFGSRATRSAKQYSDLDLAIIAQEPMSLTVRAALADEFSESDLPFKVDIVDWANTSEAFRKVIERDKVIVQGRARNA